MATNRQYLNTVIVGVLINCFIPVNCLNSSEFHLHRKLFKEYNPNVMPTENKLTPINITLDMYLMSIDNIDEKRQTITIKAFLEIKWRDEFLTWNTDDYPDVSRITVKDNDIWVPDIALKDTFDKLTELGQGDGRASIRSDGMVTIWPYKIYTVACKISISKFPFDKQNCEFDFLSWSHPTSDIVLMSSQEKPDMTYFSKSSEWDLTSSKIELVRRSYGNDFWDHVFIHFELKRKSLFHIVNMIIPVLIISILNVISFVLPSASGERVTLSISIFLTLAVFLTTVNSSMPESSDEVASFSVFVGLQLFGSAFTIMFTIISLNLFYHDRSAKIPEIFKTFTKFSRVSKANEDYRIATDLPNDNIVACLNDRSQEQTQIAKGCGPATWKMVSKAVDKLCLICAICWHIILTASLLISIST